MLGRSWSSSAVTFLDREQVVAACRGLASEFLLSFPELREIGLFGSLAAGIPTPRSDLDLYLLVPEGVSKARREALEAKAREVFAPLGLPVDVWVLTPAQWDTPLGRVIHKQRLVLAHR